MTIETPIATIPKNGAEELRIRLSEYRGSHFVDMRLFVDLKGGDGDRVPTKKGVALRLDKMPDLIEALQRAWAEAQIQGLVANDVEHKGVAA